MQFIKIYLNRNTEEAIHQYVGRQSTENGLQLQKSTRNLKHNLVTTDRWPSGSAKLFGKVLDDDIIWYNVSKTNQTK